MARRILTFILAPAAAAAALGCNDAVPLPSSTHDGGPDQTRDATSLPPEGDAGVDGAQHPVDAMAGPAACAPSPEIHGNLDPLWALTLGSGHLASVATASSGNIVIAGLAGDFFGATLTVGSHTFAIDGGTVPADGAPSVPGPGGGFVITLDPTGTLLWQRWLAFTGVVYGSVAGMGLDSSGDIYVVGQGASSSSPSAQSGFFVAKLSSDGQPLWTHSFVPSSDMYASPFGLSVAVSPGGGAAILGTVSATHIFGSTFDPATFTGFVVALDGTGQTQYTKTVTVPVGESLAGSFDASDHLLVTGQVSGTSGLGGSLDGGVTSPAFVAELDATGQPVWQVTDGAYATGSAIAATASGVYVAGVSQGAIGIADPTNVPAGGATFVASLDGAGHPTFETSFYSPGIVNAAAADPTGGVVTAGTMSYADADPGNGLLTPAGIWVVKLDRTGKTVTSARFGLGPFSGSDTPSIAIDATGDVVMGGGFSGAIDLGTGAIASNAAGSDTTMFVAKYAPRAPAAITPRAACPLIVDGGIPDAGRLVATNPPTSAGGDVALGSGSVFWTTAGEVMAESLPSGSPTVLADEQNPVALATDSHSLYWLNGSGPLANGSVVSVGLDGGAPVTLVSGLDAPYAFAVDDVGIYWTAGGRTTADGGTSPGSVAWAPFDGGAPTVLVTGLGSPGPIAVDHGVLAYASRVPASPDAGAASLSTPSVIATIARAGGGATQVAATDHRVASLVLDATNVYWSDANSQGVDTSTDDGRIQSAPLQPGSAILLADRQRGPGKLVLLGSTLYWGTMGSWGNAGAAGNAGVFSMATSGGTITPILSNLPSAQPFALDSAHVAWGEILDSNAGVSALFVKDR